MRRSKNGTLGTSTATLYEEVVTLVIQCDIQQNTLHVRQHHIFHIEKWCSYDIRHTAFAFPVWLTHDSCHHNVSQCYASEKFFLFGQVLEDDHGSPDNGIPHVDETPENPLASHHMFYAVAKPSALLNWRTIDAPTPYSCLVFGFLPWYGWNQLM
jgi:hypothetical protein